MEMMKEPVLVEEPIMDVEVYEQRTSQFAAISADNLREVNEWVDTLKEAERALEEKRMALVKPKNDAVNVINAELKPKVAKMGRLWRALADKVAFYLDDQKRLRNEAQQRAIEAATRKRAEEEAYAQLARDEAARLRQEGDEVNAEVLEVEAQTSALNAALIAPNVVPQVPKAQDVSGGKLSYLVVEDWDLAGWDRKQRRPANHPMFDRWTLADFRKYCSVDPVQVSAALKSDGKLSAPFVLTKKTVTRSTR